MSINKLIKELEKQYSIKKASEIIEESKIKTGIYALDYVLGGGISQCEGGHRIEFFGAEGTAKTTFSLYIIKKYILRKRDDGEKILACSRSHHHLLIIRHPDV